MSKRSRSPQALPTGGNTTSISIDPEIPDEGEESPPSKYRTTSDPPLNDLPGSIQCSLPPHHETVYCCTPDEYEQHYAREHSNRCSSCSKNFPSAHLLSLHIDERHNVLREARAANGERTYQCFVETCDRLCSTPQKRRLHLIDKHMFPRTYNFRIVDQGVDKSTSLLKDSRRRRVSTAGDMRETNRHSRQPSSLTAGQADHSELDEGSQLITQTAGRRTSNAKLPTPGSQDADILVEESVEVGDLTKAMSALRFVPPSVSRLQRGKSKPS